MELTRELWNEIYLFTLIAYTRIIYVQSLGFFYAILQSQPTPSFLTSTRSHLLSLGTLYTRNLLFISCEYLFDSMRGLCPRCKEYRGNEGDDAWGIDMIDGMPTCARCGSVLDVF